MTEQIYADGDLAYTNDGDKEIVCTSVRYQETDGVRHSFEYTFRSTAEIDAELEAAEAARKAQEELENQSNEESEQ